MEKGIQGINETLENSFEFKESLLSIVAGDKVLKALADAVLIGSGFPMASIGTSVIIGIIDYIQKDRTIDFFKALAKNPKILNENLIKSNEFVHKFMITYKAALATYKEEKIRLFANLFINGADKNIPVDTYEEYLQIINDFSNREIKALWIIDDFYVQFNLNLENKTEEEKDQICDEAFKSHKGEFFLRMESELGLEKEEIRSFLYRLSRNQLYEIINYTFGGSPGFGKLTPLYYKIKKIIINDEL